MLDDKNKVAEPGCSGALARTVAAVAISLFWCISAVVTTVGTTVGLNHAGHRYKRCNQHTGRSASEWAARVSGSSALAGAGGVGILVKERFGIWFGGC